MLLEHVKNINFVDEELEAEYAELSEVVASMLIRLDEEIDMPEPGKADRRLGSQEYSAPEDMVSAMEVVVKQMEAAKNAMAIVNKMSDSPSRTRNRSRVMGNLNKIRGSLDRVFKQMQTMADSGQYEENPAY